MAATKRYLRDSDYNKIIFANHLAQLTQGNSQTLIEAELDAEACITAMLTNEYEIENEFLVGDSIVDYNSEKEYFRDAYVTINGKISKSNTYINPSRIPNTEGHWGLIDSEEYDDSINYVSGTYVSNDGNLYHCYSEGHTSDLGLSEEYFEIVGLPEDSYSQDQGYYIGGYVFYEDAWFVCNIANGVGSDSSNEEIVQPILIRWKETVDGTGATTFNIKKPYKVGDKVSYDGKFYDCIVATNTSGLSLYPDTLVVWESVVNEAWNNAKDYSLEAADKTLVNESNIDYKLVDPSLAVIGTTPTDSVANNDGAWAVVSITPYIRENRYERVDGFSGFVSLNNTTYYISEINEQFAHSVKDDNFFVFTPTTDPRNRNIINAMLHLVMYQLHSVVVPDNIPTVRIANNEGTMKKLESFSKMKADPNIPRKIFTITTKNPITGAVSETERSASRWAVNNSEQTRDNWEY